MEGLKIGELARSAEVGVETVRFYERIGLLEKPPRSPAGYRQYSPEVALRLRFIRRAKAAGFSLREINELLELRSSGRSAASVREIAKSRIGEIDLRLDELRTMRRVLEKLVAGCDGAGTVSRCTILAALDPSAQE